MQQSVIISTMKKLLGEKLEDWQIIGSIRVSDNTIGYKQLTEWLEKIKTGDVF